jgi:protein ImuB
VPPGAGAQDPRQQDPREKPRREKRPVRQKRVVRRPPDPQPAGRQRAEERVARKKRKKATRIACIVVPLFPLAARLRCEPELLREGVAIFEGDGAAARVVAATRPARAAGVVPGMTLTQARARLPKLIARARDPECERTAQEVLLEVADAISPRVEDPGPEQWGTAYLDTSGLERLYRDAGSPLEAERALGAELVRRLGAEGLPARAGIAASKLAARVAAGLPDPPVVVECGDEAEFLAPLPLYRLSPDTDVAATLSRWGITSIGQLARLPENEVASRLGDAGRRLHEIARGLDPRPLIARQPSPVFREGLTLEWPVINLEPFLFLARNALERLCRRLEQRGLGCRRLETSLRLEPDGYYERSIELPSPTRDEKTLLTLLRLDLEAHPPGAPVIGFQLSAHPDAPKLAQLSLLGPASLSPDRLAETLARLFALLGPGRIGSPRSPSGHRPERFQLVEYTPPPPPKVRPPVEPGRGLLAVRVLRPPIELEVLTDGKPPETGRAEEIRGRDREEPAGGRPRAGGGPSASGTGGGTTKAGAARDGAADATGAHASRGDEVLEGVASLDRQAGIFRCRERPAPRPREVAPATPEPKGIEVVPVLPERGRGERARPTGTNAEKVLRIQGRVRVASGPWELEECWWAKDRTERDYWDVELDDGALYRLYRDRRTNRWFADGVYD